MKLLRNLMLGAVLFTALLIVGGLAAWITVRVMTGKGSVEVPQLIGLDMSDAIRKLDQAGLRVHIDEDDTRAFDDVIAANQVLRQTPSAGSFRKRDSSVRVVLSLGPKDVYVPRVVGEAATTAQARIHDAGLRVGDVVYVPSRAVPEGVVMDQEPARLGSSADSVVNLLVSSGAVVSGYVMPDLIGKPSIRARAKLELHGFRVRTETEVYDGVPEDTVVRQKPLSGYMVRAGDPVLLWTSRSAQTTGSP